MVLDGTASPWRLKMGFTGQKHQEPEWTRPHTKVKSDSVSASPIANKEINYSSFAPG